DHDEQEGFAGRPGGGTFIGTDAFSNGAISLNVGSSLNTDNSGPDRGGSDYREGARRGFFLFRHTAELRREADNQPLQDGARPTGRDDVAAARRRDDRPDLREWQRALPEHAGEWPADHPRRTDRFVVRG